MSKEEKHKHKILNNTTKANKDGYKSCTPQYQTVYLWRMLSTLQLRQLNSKFHNKLYERAVLRLLYLSL